MLLVATSAAPAGPTSLAATIRAAHWQKRVLLVAAPSARDTGFQQQQQLLAATPGGLHERDVLVLDVLHDQLSPADQQFLRQHSYLKLSGFEAVLIGKDGGVKQRSARPLAPAESFATIDQMPMRRQEMRRAQ